MNYSRTRPALLWFFIYIFMNFQKPLIFRDIKASRNTKIFKLQKGTYANFTTLRVVRRAGEELKSIRKVNKHKAWKFTWFDLISNLTFAWIIDGCARNGLRRQVGHAAGNAKHPITEELVAALALHRAERQLLTFVINDHVERERHLENSDQWAMYPYLNITRLQAHCPP